MSREETKILTLAELQPVREELRERGRTVVQCHGCFDIVHPGHIRYLQFAKQQADVLIVSLTADEVVAKGENRPYINEQLRAENLAALECVDYVCVDDHSWAGHILQSLRPDVYVKGKEYETNGHPGFLKEKSVVEEYGGKVIYSSGDVVYSSTAIINGFRERYDLRQERIASYCRQHDVTFAKLQELLQQFRHLRVLVVGDPILDQYIHCDAKGVAAENPILCVSPLREDWFVGAGGLVAKQLAALGGHSGFLTLLDHSPEAQRFSDSLADDNLQLVAVDVDQRPTYVKTRYLVDDVKVFKVDTGQPAPLSSLAGQELLRTLDRVIENYDAVVAIDFGYGFFTREIIDALPQLAADHDKRYYIDVSTSQRSNILKFKGHRLATPTESELRFAFADNESGLSNLALRYYRETGADHLILTMDKRGILNFSPPQGESGRLRTDFLPAFLDRAVDTVGAGDVFHAAVVMSDLAGASIQTGGYLGSCLAAMHVDKMGNRAVRLDEIQRFLTSRGELVC